MGSLVSLTCQTCNYRVTFHLGVGAAGSLFEDGLEGLPRKSRDEIQRMIDEHRVIEKGHERAAFQCPNCHALYQLSYITLVYESVQGQRKAWVLPHYCLKCGSILELLFTDREIYEYMSHRGELSSIVSRLPCPRCSKVTLVITGFGFWD